MCRVAFFWLGAWESSGSKDPERCLSSPWIWKTGGPRPTMEWSTLTPRDVKANAALYCTMFVRNSFAGRVSPVNKLYNGKGGTRRGGNFTLPCPQHIPNSGRRIDGDDTHSSSQWRALQSGQHTFMLPKSLTCKVSITGRRAIQNNESCAMQTSTYEKN